MKCCLFSIARTIRRFKLSNELTQTSAVATRIDHRRPATDSGQKVHNLRVAVTEIDPRMRSARVCRYRCAAGEELAAQLVAPLADETLGASTVIAGLFRSRGGLASRLRGVWNASIASALGSDTAKNFCWGGSTAIRRSTFERLQRQRTLARHRLGRFHDHARSERSETSDSLHAKLSRASVGDCDFSELLEFTTRQIKITRVYASHLWLPLLLGSALFALVFFGGISC